LLYYIREVKKYNLLFLFTILPLLFLAGSLDSVEAVTLNMPDDTSKVKNLIFVSNEYEYRDPQKCFDYGKQAFELAKKLKYTKGIGNAQSAMALGIYKLHKYEEAVENYLAAIEIQKDFIDDPYPEARSWALIARAYSRLTWYDKAIEAYMNAIKILEEMEYDAALAAVYNNMAIAYKYQQDYELANSCFRKAAVFDAKSENDENKWRYDYNIGEVHYEAKNLDSALLYYKKSYENTKKYNGEDLQGYVRYGFGQVYLDRKEYAKALEELTASQKSREEYYDPNDQVYTLVGLGKCYTALNNYAKANEVLDKALKYAIQEDVGKRKMMAYEALSVLKFKQADYKKAYEYYHNFIELKDVAFNEERSKIISKMQTQFNVERKDQEIALLNQEKETLHQKEKLQAAEIEKSNFQKMTLVIGLLISLLVGVILILGIKKRNQLNRQLKHQKDIVEEKNKEITDSIQYAKRLQNAILPPTKLVKSYLQESFILYRPRDIVAGDFYWMEHTDDAVLFAVADCTGHGVPGAMVSVVCSNCLNRAVKEMKLYEPGKILDEVSKMVEETFEKSENQVRDGMDISICAMNFNSNKIKWAGANLPLWIINESGIQKIKPNKQPIGLYEQRVDFDTHEIEIQKGDSVYLFSDGYIDQFGGEKGKKLKLAGFENLLLSIYTKPMEEQKDIIENFFNDWKGDLEQLDDVCVIGLRV